MRWVLALAIVAGCAKSSSVTCDDGRVCPDKTECDTIHTLCVPGDAFAACTGIADGTKCMTTARAGICDQGVCIPGCGDGVQDEGEECDDGNQTPHDGCAATCVAETATWLELLNPWQPRTGQAAAYDSTAGNLFMFGGSDNNSITNDLWVRNKFGLWTRFNPTPSPPARRDAVMAFDANRNRIVLFGGTSASSQPLGDTWELDGTGTTPVWQQKSPATSPTPRSGAGAAYDPVRMRVILFGGEDDSNAANYGLTNDTWSYDGTTWTSVATTGTPAPRRLHAMTWDVARSRIVAFGGYRPPPGAQQIAILNAETWELTFGTGYVWTCTAGDNAPCPNATHPSLRVASSLANSTTQGGLVLFGGLTFSGVLNANVPASDTWLYSAGVWTALAPTVSPDARSEMMVTDVLEPFPPSGAPNHRPILMGGATTDDASDEVWDFRGTAAQSTWSPNATPGTVLPRGESAVVYDPVKDRTLRIGGFFEPFARGDVFLFNGKDWGLATQNLNDISEPRYSAAVTYDTTRSRVVLFSGLGLAAVPQPDTLVWDGTNAWTSLTSTGPSARTGAAMAHDDNAGTTVLFGGYDSDQRSPDQSDTWELDATTWTPNVTAGGPRAQSGAAMAYDPVQKHLVLFDVDGMTWTYENRVWTPLPTTMSPPARTGGRLVWSSIRSCITLFGGVDSTSKIKNDMWELLQASDGSWAWNIVLYTNPPIQRSDPGVVAHTSLKGILVHGGTTSAGSRLHDTWLLEYLPKDSN